MDELVVTIPLHIFSEANERGAWHASARRTRDHRRLVEAVLRTKRRPALPAVVTLVRIAPCALDDDNLARAMKGIRDEVAVWLCPVVVQKGKRRGQLTGNDRDPRVTWRVAQRRGRPREYAVEIHVRAWSMAHPGARCRALPEGDVVELVLSPADRARLAHQLGRTTGPIEFTTEGLRLLVATAEGRVRAAADAAGLAFVDCCGLCGWTVDVGGDRTVDEGVCSACRAGEGEP